MEIGRRYHAKLKNNKNIVIQNIKTSYSNNIYWVFGVLLKKNYRIKRNIITKKLFRNNIQTRDFFFPMHKQKILKKMKIFNKRDKYPVSEYLGARGFYLPSGLGIKNKEIDFVCEKVNKIIN